MMDTLIEQKKGFHNLNEGLAEIAELRLQYPVSYTHLTLPTT
mgnify:CR=1 FL=1